MCSNLIARMHDLVIIDKIVTKMKHRTEKKFKRFLQSCFKKCLDILLTKRWKIRYPQWKIRDP